MFQFLELVHPRHESSPKKESIGGEPEWIATKIAKNAR